MRRTRTWTHTHTHTRTRTRTARAVPAALAALFATTTLVLAGTAPAHADSGTPGGTTAATARDAVAAPATTRLLTRFFARDGVTPLTAAAPHLEGPTVTVDTLDPDFVAGRRGAPVARPDFTATKAVAANGSTASVWAVHTAQGWKVVNIATGADETEYVAKGSARPGGTVFREPQIDAWYVLRDGRILPLDPDAVASVGTHGTTVAAYQRLVHRRYGDKLPGSAYDRRGEGGGFGPDTGAAGHTGGGRDLTAPAAAAGGALALAAAGTLAVRRRRAHR